MKEISSRRLDRWIGVPLCGLLSALRRLARWWPRRTSTAPPRKILFIKLSEMGALVLAMPAFEAAARRVGRQGLYLVMLEGNREMLDLLGAIPPENVRTLSEQNLWTFARDVLRLVWFVRRESIDAVIDLEGFARISAILSFLTGAARRVGLDRYTSEGPYRGHLCTHPVSLNYYQHASQQFLTLVETLDEDPRRQPLLKRTVELTGYQLPPAALTAAERAEARGLVRRVSGREPSSPWIVLNPNLVDLLPLRRWPRDHYRELGRRILAAHPGATLLLTGLPVEREASAALAREISADRCWSLAGQTASVRSLVALLAECQLLVTSDCGPAHMAALTSIPIVSLFGPETPRLYAPLSPRNRSLWAGLACSPCLTAWNHRRSSCRDNVCLSSIGVEEVWQACCEMCPELASPTAQ